MALRNQYKDLFEKKHGVKLGFMGFFVRACDPGAEGHPGGQCRDRRHRPRSTRTTITSASRSAPTRACVVPVVRDAEHMSLAGIEKTITDFGKRAPVTAR